MTEDYRYRLFAARNRLGLTQQQMAERILEGLGTYEQWEAGDAPVPGSAVVAAEAIASRTQLTVTNIGARVRELADGTRTAKEITAAIGCNKHTVYHHLKFLKANGSFPLTRRNPVMDQIVGMADGSLTAVEIATALGKSVATVYQNIRYARSKGLAPTLKRQKLAYDGTSARNADIAARVAAGSTFEAIGLIYGISRERVRQIAGRLGVKSTACHEARSRMAAEKREVKAAAREAKRKKFADQLRHGLDLVAGGMSIRRAAKIVGVRESRLAQHVAQSGVESRYGRWHRRGLLAALEQAKT